MTNIWDLITLVMLNVKRVGKGAPYYQEKVKIKKIFCKV